MFSMLRVLVVLLNFGLPASFVDASEMVLHIAISVAEPEARTPHTAKSPGGSLHEFNQELAREICRRINARCTIDDVLFPEILPGVEAGIFALGFGNYLRSPEREKLVAFSDSISSSSSRLLRRVASRHLAHRSGTWPDSSLDQIRDVRICSIAGSQQFAYLERVAAAQGLTLVGTASMGESFALLDDGRVDLCLVPMFAAYELLRRRETDRFEFIGPAITENGLGGSLHIALPHDNRALRREINQALAAMRADGSFHRLVRRHFPFSLD